MGDKRTDEHGRAYAGSQRHIQTYVNEDPGALTIAIGEALPSLDALKPVFRWVSPLEEKKYAEYKDEKFIHALGFSEVVINELNEFWPKGGPVWDALAYVTLSSESGVGHGVILVEAKSHPEEIKSNMAASSSVSISKIQKSLKQTKRWLGVAEEVDWTKEYYQMANRLAHLYFFHRQDIPAWLVNIYFLNDPHSPTSLEEWQKELLKVKQTLGLNDIKIPHTADVLLEAED